MDPEYLAMMLVYVPLSGGADDALADALQLGPPAGVNYAPSEPFPRAKGRPWSSAVRPTTLRSTSILQIARRGHERGLRAGHCSRVEAVEKGAEERRKAVAEARKRLGLD
jgi:hypothetical protein